MIELNEENIEQFIQDNKEKFDKYCPEPNHEQHFLIKLYNKFKIIISIIPYLIRVFIVTIIIFILSIWVWNSWIRKDRHEVTLKQKIENIIHFKK
jgi:hypothetical protein